MDEKNRYLFLEILFTFFLLVALILLLGDILSVFRIYLILALTGAFLVGVLLRDKQTPLTKAFLNIAVLAIFLWIVYSLLNSSLLQREVISTFIKGSIILGIILSLDIFNIHSLTIIQALSIPLFMCFPIFTKAYNEVQAALILVYVFCWVAILRVKFYKFLEPAAQKGGRYYFSFLIAAIILSTSIFSSLYLSRKISPRKIENGGFLLMEEKEAEAENQALEKNYYELQDKIQKEASKLIPELSSKEDKYEILLLLSSLIKESNSAMEIQKAENGLVSRFKNPGPGIEKAQGEDIATGIKNYVDKKIMLNLRNSKEDITDNLKKNRFNIIERFSISNWADKIQNSSSGREIKKYEKEVKQAVNNSLAGETAKKALRRSAQELEEWKMFQLYRKESDFLNKQIDSLPKRLKKELSDASFDIDNIDNLSGLKKTEERLEKLKESIPSGQKDMTQAFGDILELRTEMLLAEKKKSLEEKAEGSNLPAKESQALEESIGDIKEAGDFRDLSRGLEEYRGRMEENGLLTADNAAELTGLKAHLILNKRKERIKGLFKDSNLPDKGEGLIKDFDNLGSQANADKLASESKRLKANVEKLSNEGFISKSSRDKLIKEIDDLGGFSQARLKAGIGRVRKQGPEGEARQAQANPEEKKLTFIKISPDALELAVGETGKFSATGIYSDNSQEDLTLLGEWSSSDDKIALASAGKIEAVSYGEAKVYIEYTAIKSLPASVKVKGPRLASIIVTPQDLQLPIRKKASLKAEAYFSDSSRKDVTLMAGWEVSNPRIINVEKGRISPLRFGESMVCAVYAGKKSLLANIEIIFTWDWLAYMVIRGIFLLLLGVIAVFAVLYILTEKKRADLRAYLDKDPRVFISGIYENMRDVLGIFNLSYKESLPPLSYAELVQKTFSLENNLFLRLTARFEEARYSEHILSKSDAALALNDYNEFLKILFGRCSKVYLFLKYCQSLIYRTPFLIPSA